jgi:hypothetical protein
MRIPLEIAIVLGALSISLMRDAVRYENSPPQRAAMGLTALGGMVMAIAGRMPPLPDETGFSLLVTIGGFMVTGGLIGSIGLSIASLIDRLLARRRSADRER